MVLTIDADQVIRTAGLDSGSAADQTAAAYAIADLQAGYELELRASALADTTIRPLLTLGVTELLAADLLDRRSRVVGYTEGITAGSVTVTRRDPPGPDLRAQGAQRLRPYRRRSLPAITRREPGRLSLQQQEKTIGISQADRVAGNEETGPASPPVGGGGF